MSKRIADGFRGLITYRNKRFWRSFALILLLLVVASGAWLMLRSFIVFRGRTFHYVGESYSEAKRFAVISTFLPRRARNISYWVVPFDNGIAAKFDLTEAEFTEWCQRQGWELTLIDKSKGGLTIDNVYSPSRRFGGSVAVTRGYLYREEEPPDFLRLAVYDAEKGVAYFTQ